jgi:Icc-related predicted phosphoesterase
MARDGAPMTQMGYICAWQVKQRGEAMATGHAARPVHQFGKARPSGDGNFRTHVSTPMEVRDTHFRPLPPPTGNAPYHLDLASVLPANDLSQIANAKKLTFHVNGDMGGISFAVPQQLVAKGMEGDFVAGAAASENPAFLYILGDCVYFNGALDQYNPQFFVPYEHYGAPIFAVPGNHDGENLPPATSLDGFLRCFCDTIPRLIPQASDTGRTTMTQPNVYWVLRTPLVNFVGLYSNVPEGGDLREPQITWLVEQLKNLPASVPLILTLHHPIYSADIYHSGSTHMKGILEAATVKAGRHPDMVLAGHVHDFQRISKDMGDGTVVPYLVAGAGGYHNLHAIVKVDGEKLVAPTQFQDKEGEMVTLEKYSDDNHGFLRLEVTETTITGRYYTVPRPQEPYSKGSSLLDYFEYDWKRRHYIPNKLTANGA